MLWHRVIDSSGYYDGPRPTAWEGGKFDTDACASADNPRLWIGYRNPAGEGVFVRLDGATGDTLDTVVYGAWGAPVLGYGPYGGAVNGEGDLVATGLGADPSIHIDAETLELTDLGSPCANCCKYGMGLDHNGDIWVGGCAGEGVYHYDFSDAEWTVIPGAGGTRVQRYPSGPRRIRLGAPAAHRVVSFSSTLPRKPTSTPRSRSPVATRPGV